MGDGEHEFKTDITKAFDIVKRNHPSGEMEVASTSCRMVSFQTMEKEIETAHLSIVEKGITSSMPDFDSLMYFVMRKSK